MPNSVRGATSVGVLPHTLCRSFSETQVFASLTSEYHDGSAQRVVLVSVPRHAWNLGKRLTPGEMEALRSWWDAHAADAFYFYNPKETVRPNHPDPTGVATAGRYLVRFDSDWSETLGIALGDASVRLIEVASADEAAPPSPVIVPVPDPQQVFTINGG